MRMVEVECGLRAQDPTRHGMRIVGFEAEPLSIQHTYDKEVRPRPRRAGSALCALCASSRAAERPPSGYGSESGYGGDPERRQRQKRQSEDADAWREGAYQRQWRRWLLFINVSWCATATLVGTANLRNAEQQVPRAALSAVSYLTRRAACRVRRS